jgi:hypothetical protein
VRAEEVCEVLESDAGSGNFERLGCPAVCLIVVAIGSFESPSNEHRSELRSTSRFGFAGVNNALNLELNLSYAS